MSVINVFLFYFLALILETTVLHHFSIFGAKPDLVLIILVFLAVKKGSYEGEIYGFIGGLLEDFITSAVLGLQALVKTLLGFAVGFLKNKFEEDNALLVIIFVFFASVFNNVLSAVIRAFFTPYSFSYGHILQIIISGVYTALLAPFVFHLLKNRYHAYSKTNI